MITTKEYLQLKKAGFTTREKKSLVIRKNGRSADWILPNFSVGCEMQCAYCVEEGTLISTPKSLIPVEQIQETSEVFSYNSFLEQLESAHVYHVQQREVDLVFEIQAAGVTLYITPEHPVYTQNRGWVEAQYLTTDDVVLYDEIYKE